MSFTIDALIDEREFFTPCRHGPHPLGDWIVHCAILVYDDLVVDIMLFRICKRVLHRTIRASTHSIWSRLLHKLRRFVFYSHLMRPYLSLPNFAPFKPLLYPYQESSGNLP